MPNAAVIGLASLGGYWLIAVILLLVVAEEIGVPMPFAPGDMLLVLAGAAVATVHLNPVVVAIAMYLAALSGAVIGRELFGGSVLRWLESFQAPGEPGELSNGLEQRCITAARRLCSSAG